MSVAIIITTINKPVVIESYLKNIQKYAHTNVVIIVVGDKKTPSGVGDYCNRLSKESSIAVKYIDIDFQVSYLKSFPELGGYLPYNSFARRNIGDLLAYEEGFSTVIRVDDDNFPTDDDFIRMHSIVGQSVETDVIKSDNGWYNVCEELVDEHAIPFYPRGFPYSKRWSNSAISKSREKIRVVLNAGLWMGDPDVDAITRLCKPINAISFKRTYGNTFALAKGTWCPINTQNTSYSREIIPASFVPPNVGRYDDIWSGYLLRKITDHMGDYVTYGRPLLYQERNIHNLWHDLENELNGNVYTDHLINCFNNIKLTKTSYLECYYELAEKLKDMISENRDVFESVLDGMQIWVNSISKIGK